MTTAVASSAGAADDDTAPRVEAVRPTRIAALAPWLIAVALLAALPFVFPSRTAMSLAGAVGINVVFALSYNMLLGQGGMLSFGHAVYYGLGGFAAMHLLVAIDKAGLGFPVFALPLVGFAGGLLAGAVLGWPICRRSGTPFAMITLGIGELIAAGGLMFVSLFGGEEGIKGDRMVGPKTFGLSLGPPTEVYWFIAFWVLAAALAMWAFTLTPLGRLSNAVRDNPDRVQFVGYDPTRIRYIVFMLSSGFAGLAGGMAAVQYEILTPETFSSLLSGAVLLMAFIGGVGVFYGPILGAILITVMQSMLSDYTEAWQFYVGLLFLAVVMFAPGGLGGMIERARAAGRRGEAGRLAPVWAVGAVAVLVLAAGVSLLIELVFHLRGSEETLAFLGLDLSPRAAPGWLLALALVVLGSLGLKAAPRLAGGSASVLRRRPA